MANASLICVSEVGSSIVVKSPGSRPSQMACIERRSSLPERVLGNRLTQCTREGRATGQQQSLYALAVEQVQYNCSLLRPGLTFRDYTRAAWPIPARFDTLNYGCVAHGVGMIDEWPGIGLDLSDPFLMDGVFEPGMTICVESYIGEPGGSEGVKFEEQVLITETGYEILSKFPLEQKLQ